MCVCVFTLNSTSTNSPHVFTAFFFSSHVSISTISPRDVALLQRGRSCRKSMSELNFGLTDGVGRQALRMASELECRGVYLGSCRIGCILKGCLLFIDIMIAEVREGCFPSSSFGSVLVVF